MFRTFICRAANRFNGMFDKKWTQKVFSTAASVGSESDLNRPAPSTGFVVAGHGRPVSFATSGDVATYARHEPRGTLGAGRIFEAVRGMATISCVSKPCAAPLTATDARQHFRQPLVAKNDYFGTVSGARTQNVFSTVANVASKSNWNRPAASTGFVVAGHGRPASFATSGDVATYARHEPRGTLGAGRIFEAVRGMATISCVSKPCAAPLAATDARQHFRQPSVATNGFFGTVSGLRTQKVFSTVASKSILTRPATSTGFVVAGHGRPASFFTRRSAGDLARSEPQKTRSRPQIFINVLIKVDVTREPTPLVAINGFGQLGRRLLRLAIERNFSVEAINEPFADIHTMARSFKEDTVLGTFPGEVKIKQGNRLWINDKVIRVCHEINPENINWRKLKAQYVIDSTGICIDRATAMKHISRGAKKVIVTRPSKNVQAFYKGVNFGDYQKTMSVVSIGSSTANCALPLMNIMKNNFGIHSYLVKLSCLSSGEHFQYGPIYARSEDFTRMTTDQIWNAKAILEPFNEFPMNVGYLELHFRLRWEASPEIVKSLIDHAVKNNDGVIKIYEHQNGQVVSKFVRSRYSAILDVHRVSVHGTLVKIGAWYNGTTGIASRTLDLIKHMVAVDYY